MSNDKVHDDAPVTTEGDNVDRASSEETWRTPSDPFPLEITQVVPRDDDPDYVPIEQAVSS